MSAVSFPKSSIHVVLLEGISPTARELLTRQGYTKITEVEKALRDKALLEQVRSAHVLGIRSRTQLTAEVLEAAPKLFAVGCFCIGTNQVDLAAAARLGITVFNAPHSNTRSVAELVLAEMVMLMRKIGDMNTG